MSPPVDTVTMALSGDGPVPLRKFAQAIEHFYDLLQALTQEAGDDSIDWVIDNLEMGSAVATAKGTGNPERVATIVRSSAKVATDLAQNRPIQHSKKVQQAAKNLQSVIDGKVTSLRLETSETEAVVICHSRIPEFVATTGPMSAAFGTVEGRIQTLTNRGGLRFTLYDLLNDQAVSCHLEEGYETIMRHAWRKLVMVTGWVSRDPLTGRPRSIRNVKDVQSMPEETGDYRDARSSAPSLTAVSPEEAIRTLRDG